ncbi:TonB-dependent receptor family protein [Sphingomonas turrisvirgatae]|uniref:Uncharacterized protein n=1 Tax=Sphingomonas turrisvirgatae TaxID=1888892 RepID=A0A1E3LYT4_9SPHN|nr:TonB-dependent receptor [Sphingomonas turrisvirgatae]ODP38879.1 hypothetical protein BFL28_13240 [Sphingomonas turrisvirgatae]
MVLKFLAAASATALVWPLATHAQGVVLEAESPDADDGEIIVRGRNIISNVETIAGNASIISADQVETGRAGNVGDALRYQPGVVAQTASGGEATRLSMRGSGIIRNPFTWGTGIQMLLDGLPMTTAEGSPYEFFEPLANNHMEVYRGANSFDYSPTTQGGAINYVPHNGTNAAGLLLRAEGGSFGYNRQQISSGNVLGPVDYYVSATRFKMNGFRRHSASESKRIVGDVGVRITPSLQLRTYAIYAEQDTKMASGITLAQLYNDPRANNTTVGDRQAPGSVLIGSTLDWNLGNGQQLKLGAVFKDYEVRNVRIAIPDWWDIQDIGLSARYIADHDLFGVRAKTEIAVLYTALLPGSIDRKFSADYSTLRQYASFKGVDATFLIKNDLEVADRLWVTTALAAIKQTRSSHITVPVRDFIDQRHFNWAPRLGVRYDSGEIQLFANYSRSVEAPIAHALPQLTGGLYTYNADIREQVQDTVEAGVRGKIGGLHWSLAAYRTLVQRELLNVQVSPAVGANPAVVIATNAKSPTIHQGIEAGIEGVLWDNGTFKLNTQQAFSFNDFHYRNEPSFGSSQLPGVPRALYQGSFQIEHKSGFFVGAGTELLLGRYAADYSNSIWARPYQTLDLRAGWSSKDKGWQIFLDAKNVTDSRYAAFVLPVYDARGVDSAAYYQAQGANVTLGVTKAF